MQLTFKMVVFIFFSLGTLFSQDDKAIEIDFLLNYYEQDGDNSAVTGGKGTEELSNFGTKIIINIPSGENKSYNISLNADSYTSASSNNIDPVKSGASGHDLHTYANFEYTVDLPETNSAYSLSAGLSNEYDYSSFSFGGSWSIYSKDKNDQFSLSTMNYFDFVSLIYPKELRGQGKLLADDQRQTYSLSLNYSRVINKKLQISFMNDLVYQKGLLSTPFNRVYFKDSDRVDVERLPNNRFKFPIGMRVNYFLSDMIVLRTHYRYYYDTFSVSANTISLETAIRLNQTWAIIPFIRFHAQQNADIFESYKNHKTESEFYTSDYDLSSFNTSKAGVGIRYYPLDGITSIPGILKIKRLDLRIGTYKRSDGLAAFNATVGASFIIP